MNFIAHLRDLFTSSPAKAARNERKSALATVHRRFKEAVRAGDVVALEAMLMKRELVVTEELDRGRGLLQFAVMANSVKAVRFLVAMGADPSRKDSLGASARNLAQRNGSDPMLRALAYAEREELGEV